LFRRNCIFLSTLWYSIDFERTQDKAWEAWIPQMLKVTSFKKFGLVIPTVDEAENLRILLPRVRAAMLPVDLRYELLIVDDESHDGTQEIVRQHAESDSHICLLQRCGQRGLAGAVIHGWRHTDADLLGVMDADLQHPPELLPRLIDAIFSGHDIAIASRYTQASGTPGWNWTRYTVSRLGTFASMPFQKPGMRVQDPLSGFFIMRRECIEGVNFQPEGFKILLEILVRGHIKSAAEIPYQFGLRYAGTSKAGVMTAAQYLSLLRRLSRDSFFRLRKSA
jgi:dolichol-phosphate mannosyltransferase